MHTCRCRYWAVAVPTYVCVAFVFVVVLYVAYNFSITPPLDSISTITGIYHNKHGSRDLLEFSVVICCATIIVPPTESQLRGVVSGGVDLTRYISTRH